MPTSFYPFLLILAAVLFCVGIPKKRPLLLALGLFLASIVLGIWLCKLLLLPESIVAGAYVAAVVTYFYFKREKSDRNG